MYILSERSLNNLKYVRPDIVKVVKKAIELTKTDFMVFEGLRTEERQKQLVSDGMSKTFDSYHLYGLAVDLIPYVDGKLTWSTDYYKSILEAVKQAEKDLGLYVLNNGYEMWGWDNYHFQSKPINGVNAKKVFKDKKGVGFK